MNGREISSNPMHLSSTDTLPADITLSSPLPVKPPGEKPASEMSSPPCDCASHVSPAPVRESPAGSTATATARESETSSPRSLRQVLWHLPAQILIRLVRLYQYFISPWLGPCCRFEPSCSHYFIQAVRKYGAMRGAWRGVLRICRCHPWHPGGYDPP